MASKPLIVGEAPSKNGDPATPCQGRVGRRLAAWGGISFDEYLELFDRVNLMPVRVEVDQKLAWDRYAMTQRARQLIAAMSNPVWLLLGRRVQGAFGLEAGYFQVCLIGNLSMVVLPHPSGLNRYFNDPVNEHQMGSVMRHIVEVARGSGTV